MRRRISFFSIHNLYNRVNFSGVPHYMLRALQAHPDVEVVVMGDHPRLLPGWLGQMKKRLRPRTPLDLSAVAEPADLDLILSVVSTRFVAEQATRVHAFPFGLNLDDIPATLPEKPPLDPLNLLFVGSDWKRKGGMLAVAVLDTLRSRGLEATLTVMGTPEAARLGHPHVRGLGFVDKNTREGRAVFIRELSRAHLLLHPTRADCSAMVVAEANVYGCPVVVTDVGGIPSVMDPGRNGALFALEAGPAEIADLVVSLTGDPAHYRRLSQASRRHYEEKLTWQRWVEKLIEIAPAARPRTGAGI